jgi:hypothetical protein
MHDNSIGNDEADLDDQPLATHEDDVPALTNDGTIAALPTNDCTSAAANDPAEDRGINKDNSFS